MIPDSKAVGFTSIIPIEFRKKSCRVLTTPSVTNFEREKIISAAGIFCLYKFALFLTFNYIKKYIFFVIS